MEPHPPILTLRNLSRQYVTKAERLPVLKDVNLDIFAGEMVAIMGPSGCGKSTLLFILGLLLAPTSGRYEVEGRNVLSLDASAQAEFRRLTIGFIFQSCNLLESTTVRENIEFPLIYAGIPRHEREPVIRSALERVSLLHRIHHPSRLLSGGEQQRVAIARALVNRPRILLADEPTGQLDRTNSTIIMNDFKNVVADGDKAMVVVTHDPEVAAQCNRVFRLEEGFLRPG